MVRRFTKNIRLASAALRDCSIFGAAAMSGADAGAVRPEMTRPTRKPVTISDVAYSSRLMRDLVLVDAHAPGASRRLGHHHREHAVGQIGRDAVGVHWMGESE